jgi:hypothetical protein
MRIEALIVCLHYADVLAETLPSIKAAADSVTVMTRADDLRTVSVCSKAGVRWIFTDALNQKDGELLRVGNAINEGLGHLGKKDWVLSIDADIWLPPHTRKALDWISLDPSKLYGCDRLHCVGRSTWDKVSSTRQLQQDCIVLPVPLRLGARICIPGDMGYMPSGFFQFWNPTFSGFKDYPSDSNRGTNDQGSDMHHARRWAAKDRILIPDFIAIELLTNTQPGANWHGRTTPEFCAEPRAYQP